MRSIWGALTRPSRRSTGLRFLRRTSVGTWVTLRRSAHSGDAWTSIREIRRRSRSLRARWARRLSIRRAGPEVSWVKNSNMGVVSGKGAPVLLVLERFPCSPAGETWTLGIGRGIAFLGRGKRVARLGAMELFDWYWLGVSA